MPLAQDKSVTATLAAGCFWCTEAIFKRLKGVVSVRSGYAGGSMPDPSYAKVASGSTGHAEAIQIQFDPGVIPYSVLLDIFFATHDPTQLNRQGADIGTQYRSEIFYHNEAQRTDAANKIKELAASGKYTEPIVTKLEPLTNFYSAENYHQAFYDNNSNHPYCIAIIDPKINKLIKDFSDKIKP